MKQACNTPKKLNELNLNCEMMKTSLLINHTIQRNGLPKQNMRNYDTLVSEEGIQKFFLNST